MPAQPPDWHLSFEVHLLPSSQLAPFALVGFEHAPVAGLHVPAVWQVSSAVQVTAVPPVQLPVWQVSLVVHLFPSSQVVPSALLGFEHVPVAGLHVPAAWHWSSAVQVTAVPALQLPAWQVSLVVHLSPSSQVVPSALVGFEHAPEVGSHVPAVWH